MIELVYHYDDPPYIAIGSLCAVNYSLLKYASDTYVYRCRTHFYKHITLPECVECLCQSAELLEGELNEECKTF